MRSGAAKVAMGTAGMAARVKVVEVRKGNIRMHIGKQKYVEDERMEAARRRMTCT